MIAMLLGVYLAFIFGVFFRQFTSMFSFYIFLVLFFGDLADDTAVFLTTTTPIFIETYHQSLGIVVGLHVGATGIGLFCASQINAWSMDRIYAYFQRKNEGVGEPEFRLRELLILL